MAGARAESGAGVIDNHRAAAFRELRFMLAVIAFCALGMFAADQYSLAQNAPVANLSSGPPMIASAHHLHVTGSIPVLSSCGASPALALNSSDIAGRFTTGAAATTCTLTFNYAWQTSPWCVLRSNSVVGSWFNSTTAITVDATTAGAIYTYFCIGGPTSAN